MSKNATKLRAARLFFPHFTNEIIALWHCLCHCCCPSLNSPITAKDGTFVVRKSWFDTYDDDRLSEKVGVTENECSVFDYCFDNNNALIQAQGVLKLDSF